MTQEELDEMIAKLMARFDTVNRYFIRKIARQVLKIGELNASSINRIIILTEMNQDIAEISQMLAEACRMSTQEIYQIYDKTLRDTYVDPRFKTALERKPLSETTRRRLENFAQAVSRQTAGTMRNLSNTTAISSQYRQTVDRAVLSVTSGLTDYKAAMRASIRNLGYNGMQVQYASGFHKRLDTAIRQNIVDGARQVAQQSADRMGEELQFDAYEISAHMRSAPDHEPVQGHVLLKAEYEKMQNGEDFEDIDGVLFPGFPRPIGQWNCMHFSSPFSTEYSIRRYTPEQLQKWIELNAKGCTVGGKHYTTYEASQRMRMLETETRRLKDAAIAAEVAKDDVLREQLQRQIAVHYHKYESFAKGAGLKPRYERMRVEGYHPLKK